MVGEHSHGVHDRGRIAAAIPENKHENNEFPPKIRGSGHTDDSGIDVAVEEERVSLQPQLLASTALVRRTRRW